MHTGKCYLVSFLWRCPPEMTTMKSRVHRGNWIICDRVNHSEHTPLNRQLISISFSCSCEPNILRAVFNELPFLFHVFYIQSVLTDLGILWLLLNSEFFLPDQTLKMANMRCFIFPTEFWKIGVHPVDTAAKSFQPNECWIYFERLCGRDTEILQSLDLKLWKRYKFQNRTTQIKLSLEVANIEIVTQQ